MTEKHDRKAWWRQKSMTEKHDRKACWRQRSMVETEKLGGDRKA